MPSKQSTPPWPAKPHTLAKIEILKGFLHAWFRIFGQSPPMPQCDLLYVDGFAGPGYYVNSDAGIPIYHEGSPVAAISAATGALCLPGWKAGRVHCAFIEPVRGTLNHLSEHISSLDYHSWISPDYIGGTFESRLPSLRSKYPMHVSGPLPLMLFLDPFGATGVPFSIVEEILSQERSDVLINLDADGLSRNLSAGYHGVLSNAFGNDSWRDVLSPDVGFREQCTRIVEHYRGQLNRINGVKYTYPFEMLTSSKRVGTVGYFLIFACRHSRGLERMKYAMFKMDQAGTSQFSNARVGQQALLRFDRPEDVANDVHAHFVGNGRIGRDEIWDYLLTETPLYLETEMLKSLERRGMISVDGSDPRRRKLTYPRDKVRWIEFIKED